MKRALIAIVTLALMLMAVPAFAENLEGSADFGECTISPTSIKRVDRDAKRARWVKVKALVHCDEDYMHGKVTIRLAGVTPEGVAAAGRSSKDVSIDRPVVTGDHVVKTRMRCNTRRHGEWTYSRLNLQVWMFAQVYRSGHWDRTTVTARTENLTC